MLTLEALRRGVDGGPDRATDAGFHRCCIKRGWERLRFWWQWGRGGCVSPECSLPELDQRQPSQASLRQPLLLERLEHRLCGWDGVLKVCMDFGLLLGLLATVIGLMQLLQALGPGLTLPFQGGELIAVGLLSGALIHDDNASGPIGKIRAFLLPR